MAANRSNRPELLNYRFPAAGSMQQFRGQGAEGRGQGGMISTWFAQAVAVSRGETRGVLWNCQLRGRPHGTPPVGLTEMVILPQFSSESPVSNSRPPYRRNGPLRPYAARSGPAWIAVAALAPLAGNGQRMLPSTRCLALSSLSKFVTRASVVSIKPAMLAALLSALRTTLTGSMMPALTMSTYLAELAS